MYNIFFLIMLCDVTWSTADISKSF